MTGDIDPKRLRTLNGRYSSLCNRCGDPVYSLWIDDAIRRENALKVRLE